MDLARYVVDAVVLEGRSYRDVARAHGVSKSWVGKVVGRFREGGYEATQPRSRAPKRIPHRTPDELEDEIVALRKELAELGLDAGAATIHYHLSKRHTVVPSVSTIWRVLRRRGFVTPQPHKRPRSSWIRFEAQLPNECWQSDVTHWRLGDGTQVEIVNFIDDHSRLAVAARVLATATAPQVLKVFRTAGERWGLPAALLTDNGCVYTTWHRGGPNVMQTELLALGIEFRHSRPYHPQTCGKVERFHQTMKAFLAASHPPARSPSSRPRSTGSSPTTTRCDPTGRTSEGLPRRPSTPGTRPGRQGRRSASVPGSGSAGTGSTRAARSPLRHRSRLHHISVGHAHKGKRVVMLVNGLNVRVLSQDGELLRELTLDPTRDYQPQG